MESKTASAVGDSLRNGLELVKSFSDKHIDLLRPSSRYNTGVKDGEKGSKFMLIRDDNEMGTYDKPLPCFGCGIGWFSFLLGFAFPVMWYYATFLYFGNYRKDPRERAGLAASAIAAMATSVVLLFVIVLIILL